MRHTQTGFGANDAGSFSDRRTGMVGEPPIGATKLPSESGTISWRVATLHKPSWFLGNESSAAQRIQKRLNLISVPMPMTVWCNGLRQACIGVKPQTSERLEADSPRYIACLIVRLFVNLRQLPKRH